MNNWIKISSKELEKSKEIIGLKKGNLQILLVKALVKIDKATEYIKNYDVFKEFTFPLMKRDEENQVKSSIDYQFKNDLKKNLLILLGDEENE